MLRKCLKYLKSGWNRKGRRSNRFLKRVGRKLGLGRGALRKGGGYTLFMLNVSVAFKGKHIQDFWEGARPLLLVAYRTHWCLQKLT